MKLQISDPTLAPELVGALNETDCLAAHTAADTVDVFVPWLEEEGAQHAATELLFFVRAWAGRYPEFRATLLDPR